MALSGLAFTVSAVQVISAVNGPALAQQTALVEAAKQAGTIKQFIPSEFSAYGAVGTCLLLQDACAGGAASGACKVGHRNKVTPPPPACKSTCITEQCYTKRSLWHDSQQAACIADEESVPLLYGPKAKVRQALEAAGIPHTYIVSYGFATYWANGLGELGQRDRVPPAPTGDNKVPYFGSGRTKCALSNLASPTLPPCMHRYSKFMCLCAHPIPLLAP